MDSLDLKHAKAVLLALSEMGTAKKSDLFHIVKSHQVLDNLLNALQRDGYLLIEETKIGPKKYFIKLTPKGQTIAEQLRKVQEIASGAISMNPHFDEDFKDLSALVHLNVLDDLIAIIEHNFDRKGHDRVVNVYVRLNGRGIMRLWCEADETYECKHTRFAWTLPEVQEMVQKQIMKGNASAEGSP